HPGRGRGIARGARQAGGLPRAPGAPGSRPRAARSMVEDRAAYGGLVLARTGRATLVVANGGGHAVEAVLVQLVQQAAGTALNTVDVAPTSPGDPNGLVEFYCVVFLGVGAAVG